MSKAGELTAKQYEFLKALRTRKYRYLLFGGGMGCFVSGTLVKLSNGKRKKIENVSAGDMVVTINETTGEIEHKKVLELFRYSGADTNQNLVTLSLKTGKEISCTENHEFYINRTWVSAKRLAGSLRGDVWNDQDCTDTVDLEAREIKLCDISSVDIHPCCEEYVYDLSVQDNHNYVVSEDDIIVHNSGKSYLMAYIFIVMAMQYPKTRYAIIRKHMTVLKRTTYHTFIKIAEEIGVEYKSNYTEMFWEFENGSRIYFMDVDEAKDPDLNKLKGLEVTAVGMDEANECIEGVFHILKARIGRLNFDDAVHGFIMLTCNPSDNWVKTTFYEPHEAGTIKEPYYFLQSLAKDNGFLGKSYMEGLEDLPEAEYNRYVKGDWNFASDPHQLIPYDWVRKCIKPKADLKPTQMGIDVARLGDNRTVFVYAAGNTYLGREEFARQRTTVTAKMAMERIKEKGIEPVKVRVDVVGVGGGVVDYLHDSGYKVTPIDSGSSPTETGEFLRYKNMRAQMYWTIRQMFEEQRIFMYRDEDLIKELTSIRYFVTNDKYIQVESKREIKKRASGESPDNADAFVLAMYNLIINKPKIYIYGQED